MFGKILRRNRKAADFSADAKVWHGWTGRRMREQA
jgi:hypothetical protein